MDYNKFLIVVDMQNDFVTGPLGTKEAREIVPAIQKKVYNALLDSGTMAIFTQDTHKRDYLQTREGKMLPVEHCIEGTKGWELVPELKEIVDCDKTGRVRIQPKYTFVYPTFMRELGVVPRYFQSALYRMRHEKEIEIEIVGVCTDICVISHALELRSEFPESEITVDASCCAGSNRYAHRFACEVMLSCQINVKNYIQDMEYIIHE